PFGHAPPIINLEDNTSPVRLPLFIAVNHDGDGYPDTQLQHGFTPLPSLMALGATWNPGYVQAAGQIAGQELSAVGVNMLLGPSLDVLDNQPDLYVNQGPQTLGANAYWVAKMGRAYIKGVHDGSKGGVLTVAKHF